MGFRMRRSVRVLPGVRLNFSKSGVGVSAGVPGFRVTQHANGRMTRTVSLPGTGLSHVATIGGTSSPRAAVPTPAPGPAPVAARPGWFAPKGEKELYAAVRAADDGEADRISQEHPEVALAAAVVAGFMKMERGDTGRAWDLLWWVWGTGKDPADDPFLRKYVPVSFTLVVAPGVAVAVSLDRTAVGLAVAELAQGRGDPAAAAAVVEQLEPTQVTAVSLAELYLQLGRPEEVVDLTNSVTNSDDLTALLLVFRGAALRDQGWYDAAREAFRAALASRKRDPEVRHRGLVERSRCYALEGKRSLARKDLERILAEDADYPGLQEALAALGGAPGGGPSDG